MTINDPLSERDFSMVDGVSLQVRQDTTPIEVRPGVVRRIPTRAPEITITAGDYATGPEFLSIAQAEDLQKYLGAAIEYAKSWSA